MVRPIRQNPCFVLRSVDGYGYLLDIMNTERTEKPNNVRCFVFVRKSSSLEFQISSIKRIGEEGNPLGDASLNQVGRLEDAGAVGVDSEDDNVGRRESVFSHQRVAN